MDNFLIQNVNDANQWLKLIRQVQNSIVYTITSRKDEKHGRVYELDYCDGSCIFSSGYAKILITKSLKDCIELTAKHFKVMIPDCIEEDTERMQDEKDINQWLLMMGQSECYKAISRDGEKDKKYAITGRREDEKNYWTTNRGFDLITTVYLFFEWCFKEAVKELNDEELGVIKEMEKNRYKGKKEQEKEKIDEIEKCENEWQSIKEES